jgi:hypothetical protein
LFENIRSTRFHKQNYYFNWILGKPHVRTIHQRQRHSDERDASIQKEMRHYDFVSTNLDIDERYTKNVSQRSLYSLWFVIDHNDSGKMFFHKLVSADLNYDAKIQENYLKTFCFDLIEEWHKNTEKWVTRILIDQLNNGAKQYRKKSSSKLFLSIHLNNEMHVSKNKGPYHCLYYYVVASEENCWFGKNIPLSLNASLRINHFNACSNF